MSRFPLFIELKDADVILCGSGDALRDKLAKIQSFGARIRVFTEDTIAISEKIEIVYRPLVNDDLSGKIAFVISAGNTCSENHRIYELCTARNIPINTVDVPELCTFYFPALINRANCTIGISTNGTSPAAAAALRRHVANNLPDEIDSILEWAATIRPFIREKVSPPALCRSVIRNAMDSAFTLGRPLTNEELDKLLF